jgi:hypothetical protein
MIVPTRDRYNSDFEFAFVYAIWIAEFPSAYKKAVVKFK